MHDFDTLQAVAPLQVTYSVSALCDQFITYGQDVAQQSKDTIGTRKTHLKFFAEYCHRAGADDIRLITNPLIDDFFVEYSKKRAKSTVNTARRVLKVFLRWVDNYKEIDVRANPDAIRLVRIRDRTPRAIADDIVARVIREAEEEQDRLMIAVFRESGVRVCEIVELRVEDIIDNQLRVMGKGEVDRYVNITGILALHLRKFVLSNERLPQDYLFQNVYDGYGDKMSKKTAAKRVTKCFNEIASIHVTPHQLRHSMAIGLLMDGCDLVTIQTQLGHKDIKTTMEYLRVANSLFKESYARIMKKSFIGA